LHPEKASRLIQQKALEPNNLGLPEVLDDVLANTLNKKHKDDYLNEVHDRYSRGEYIFADSIKFADSLKFTTPGGKTVYGGGGIMPDIFVPYDTALYTGYYTQVMNRGLLGRFAFQYADKNRRNLNGFKDHSEIVEYLDRQDLLLQFTAYSEKNGLQASKEDIILSQDVLLISMKALIARFILDNEGYYPIIHQIDPTVQKSLEIFAQK
jgi:carboxyl-terminal processing protease